MRAATGVLTLFSLRNHPATVFSSANAKMVWISGTRRLMGLWTVPCIPALSNLPRQALCVKKFCDKRVKWLDSVKDNQREVYIPTPPPFVGLLVPIVNIQTLQAAVNKLFTWETRSQQRNWSCNEGLSLDAGRQTQAKPHTFRTTNTGKPNQSSWQFIRLVLIIKVVLDTEVRRRELFHLELLLSCRSSKVFVLTAEGVSGVPFQWQKKNNPNKKGLC